MTEGIGTIINPLLDAGAKAQQDVKDVGGQADSICKRRGQ